MPGPRLLGRAVTFAYRKWGVKGVLGMAIVGAILYVLRRRKLEQFVQKERGRSTGRGRDTTGSAK